MLNALNDPRPTAQPNLIGQPIIYGKQERYGDTAGARLPWLAQGGQLANPYFPTTASYRAILCELEIEVGLMQLELELILSRCLWTHGT